MCIFKTGTKNVILFFLKGKIQNRFQFINRFSKYQSLKMMSFEISSNIGAVFTIPNLKKKL